MGALSIWHWLIVLAVVLLLFGSKKLPDAARGLGRSMRIFKSEMKEMQNDDKQEDPQALPQAGQPNAAQYAQPQQQQQQYAPQQQPQQPAQPQQQGYPQAPQQPYQQQPYQQSGGQQQFTDPTGPYDGGPGSDSAGR
jgi:sec-independent protein translocase protein TatA